MILCDMITSVWIRPPVMKLKEILKVVEVLALESVKDKGLVLKALEAAKNYGMAMMVATHKVGEAFLRSRFVLPQ